VTEINIRQELNCDRLLDLKALSAWTLDRQREHATDTDVYEAALASFQTYLRSQHVPGDGRLSAGRRARRVEKHLKALVNASKRAEAAARDLRNAYAAHVAHVAALPGQREAKALAKAGRRQMVGELAANSLHKTAATMAPPTPEQAPPQAPAPAPAAGGQQPRGLNALWKQAQA
jgi:hypothetical protein